MPERRDDPSHFKFLLARIAADEEALAKASHDFYVARSITEVEFRAIRRLEASIAESRATR